MKIKICGLTRREDCEAAVELGADFVGFNFYPKSPRCVTTERAREMRADLPENVVGVGVFVNETAERIREVCAEAGLAVAQLHGDETPEFCAGLGMPVIKAFRVEGAEDLAGIRSYKTWAALIDAKSAGYGGSGMRVDWELVSMVRAPLKIFLAGGLTPENVTEAVRTVRPWALDVASGVESEPGIKDRERMKLFIEAVRNAT